MQQDDLIGTTLGNYRILTPLGQGGMARVYKAYQESLEREVAVKVLPPWYAADRNFVERFKLEARLVARLSHPNIVTVHDANEQSGHLYIVMQLVDGGTLKQRLDKLAEQRKFMDLQEALPIFTQLASALTYAHEQGVIHRDVKPVNVLMDRSRRPILSDFGIAKVLAGTKDQLTRPGAGVGTPEYMSPEQCLGGQVDGRADIYALGIMLFEALTNRTPYVADNYPALAHSHIYAAPPRPSSINPVIPFAIEQVILTALEKNPQHRYETASQMADALTQAALPTINPMSPSAYRYPGDGQGAPVVVRQTPYPAQEPSTPNNPFGQYQAPPVSSQQAAIPMFACPYCQHLNKPQQRFCTKCGQPLNHCNVCNTNNQVTHRFCTKCGQPLLIM